MTGRRLFFHFIVLSAISFSSHQLLAGDEKSIAGFRDAIIALAPDVDPNEAQLVSYTAHTTARQCAKDYRVVGPSVFQNVLIYFGIRQKGYCFHYAYDIGARLRELPLKTLVLHWGEAYPRGHLEHNVVVVTARNQPFDQGYIIDGWRAAGRLLWWPVRKDEYPWKENLHETAWLQKRGPTQWGPQETNVMTYQVPHSKPAAPTR